MTDPSLKSARAATRYGFFAAGFAVSCWAPLIPFAKDRVGADEAQMGLLLLCLGFGSVMAMPVTGWLCARIGARPVVLVAGVVLALILPLLLIAPTLGALGAALLGFGASLGSLDVAINLHGIEVERRDQRPLMSGFHAQFSIGGLMGAAGVTALMWLGVQPVISALVGAVLTLGVMALSARGLIRAKGGEPMQFAIPHSVVILLAILSAVAFLVEGAILDWSALLILALDLAPAEQGGLGFVLFSAAMTLGRLTGDWTVARLGARRILIFGGLGTVAGIIVVLTGATPALALSGFALIGLGAANVVPVLFSLAGQQTVMPVGLAVASVTTIGYAGTLMGPAAVGFVADLTSLPSAFWGLAALMVLVPLGAGRAAAAGRKAP